MIARHLLGQRAAAVVLEHDEVAHQREEPVGRADALQHHLQLGHEWVGKALAGDGAPGLEPLSPGGERADARLVAVRDDEQLVQGEQGGQLGLVGLKLLPRRPDGGVLVGRVLELDHAQRQAVDEQHDVRPAPVLVLGDGELVDGQPVVIGWGFEVYSLHLRAANGSIVSPVLHRHAVDQHPVEGAVAGLQGRALRSGQPAKRVVQRVGGQRRVETGERVKQPTLQDDLSEVVAFGVGCVGGDVGAVGHLPAEGGEPVESSVLNVGFGDGGHLPGASTKPLPIGVVRKSIDPLTVRRHCARIFGAELYINSLSAKQRAI